MTAEMLDKFKLISGIFCGLLSAMPIYFLVQGRIHTGDAFGRIAPQHVVYVDQEPALFYCLLAGSVLFVGAFWGLRAWLIKALAKQVAR